MNNTDVSLLITALSDLNAYKASHPITNGQLITVADMNFNDVIDNGDLQGLLSYIKGGGGSGSVAPVPEPASIALLALALSRELACGCVKANSASQRHKHCCSRNVRSGVLIDSPMPSPSGNCLPLVRRARPLFFRVCLVRRMP